jgi:hypothetical protein|tara:strand:- start:617 stop:820 length:204 start_codon:yes stop_codon:yes gene_type:complete
MTPDVKDTVEVVGATGIASVLTVAEANEIFQLLGYILTITFTLYKFYWSIRRTYEKHTLKKEEEAKK